MNFTIKLIKVSRNGDRHKILLNGKIRDPIDPASVLLIAETLFEIEYCINEHLPHVRAHISTSEEL